MPEDHHGPPPSHKCPRVHTHAYMHRHTREHGVTLVCTQLHTYPCMHTATRIHTQSYPCTCANNRTQLRKASTHTEHLNKAVPRNFCGMPSLLIHSQPVGRLVTPTEPGIGCRGESRIGPGCAVTSLLWYGPASTFQQQILNVRINLWGPVLIW